MKSVIKILIAIAALYFVAQLAFGVGNVVLAVAAFWLIMMVGMKLLGGFSAPMAEPPPPGEMRKVKLEYRCDICGSEARMTMAPDEDPPAPRHCLEDMILITPVE